MAERLKQLLNLLTAHVRSLSPAGRFALLGLVGAVLAVGTVSLLWKSGGTGQQVLYSQLALDDAAAMTAKLKEMHIPYTLEANGTTILVPSSLVYDARLRLASEGLPQGGGMGYELFDQRTFGMTEFMQKLNYQRALQGELARTITQLAAVNSARVHIVMPEKSLFIDQQEQPTASVVLKLIPRHRLSPDQVNGIAHLVSSSVEGLDASNVTIVDTGGQILSQQEASDTLLSQTEAQLTYRQTLEQSLEHRVQSLIERAVGKGNVMVRVSATLDFQRVERTEERFDADNPAVRSEQRSKSEGGETGLLPVGVPGVRSNVDATAKSTEAIDGNNSFTRESETINYELSKMVSKVVMPSGGIQQLSVAVLVDGTYQTGQNQGERIYVPRSAEELAKYKEIVKGAVGYNEARGDRIEVANIPFEAQENLDPLEIAKEAQWLFWLNLARYGVYVILGLAFFLLAGRPLVKWLTTGVPHIPSALPRTVQELEADMRGSQTPLTDQEGAATEQIPKLGRLSVPELRMQTAEFFRSEPERAVEILRVWLHS